MTRQTKNFEIHKVIFDPKTIDESRTTIASFDTMKEAVDFVVNHGLANNTDPFTSHQIVRTFTTDDKIYVERSY